MNGETNILQFPRGEGPACLNCGSCYLKTTQEDQEFIYGLSDHEVTLHAIVPVHTCSACGLSYSDEKGEDARHEAVCRHLGVMTPAEVRLVRECHGMSRAEFARVTGLGEASLARWESGALIQNVANDQFLFLLTLPGCLERLMHRERKVSILRGIDCDRLPLRTRLSRFRIIRNGSELRVNAELFKLRFG